ncbi:glycosyltransferase family 4 protein [bacterium]|nr:glycosyltransferase family 4 protein [bacterium]
MKIAQVSPLYESVPPKLYGGTERIVSYLTEELVAQGHDVTLFASGDSVTSANLVSVSEKSLRLDRRAIDPLSHHVRMLEMIWQRADEFDIIHYHVDYLHFPFSRRIATPHVTTLHGQLGIPGLGALYEEFSEIPVISISNAQRAPLPHANWQATIYHGMPRDLLRLNPRAQDGTAPYVAFVGRISPEKQADHAIRIARAAGITLRIAAKIDNADKEYYAEVVEPLIHADGVEFVGEIDDRQKQDFIGNARAILFPINWNEPFGIVMIEAFACGTPVIAYRCGSVPEVMIDGVTGFVVDGPEQAVEALRAIDRIDRAGVRRVFDNRYTADRMTADYLDIYRRLAGNRSLAHAEVA